MNTHINQLLEKYWEGETTLQEEKEIKSYFSSDSVAEEHRAIAPLFDHFVKQKNLSYDKDIHTVLESSLLAEAATDTEAPIQSSAKVFSLRNIMIAVAAVFAIVLSATFVIQQETTTTDIGPRMASNIIILDGSDDSEEALQVTKEALAFLSGKLNKSGKEVSDGIQNLNKLNVVN